MYFSRKQQKILHKKKSNTFQKNINKSKYLKEMINRKKISKKQSLKRKNKKEN